jgi:hypothetical protein
MITLLRRPSTLCSVPRTVLWTRAGSGEACAVADGAGVTSEIAREKDEAERALVRDQCMSSSPEGVVRRPTDGAQGITDTNMPVLIAGQPAKGQKV